MGIVLTHKIAGPIMVIKRRMADIERGDFGAQIKLRKGDEFKDLADSFNKMLNSLTYLFKKK
jgi:nitrogen fixation/metabolism regulation signal transduction histidine kinase